MSATIRIVKVAITLLLMSLTSASVASATLIWDETSNGSLSTDRFTPTAMGTLGTGSNNLLGSTVSGISKFFSITIGAGDQLTALIVEDWQSLDDLGFLGVVDGAHFSVDPTNPNVPQLLGYHHYGEPHVGLDILPNLGQGPGSQGFTAPLGPGTYSFWVRQGGADLSHWDLNFVVVTPEPGTAVLLCAGLTGLAMRRKRD